MESNVNIEKFDIKWHPSFFAALKLELEDYKDLLIFEAEHQLSKEPLRIDVTIIKKEIDIEVKKNIGQIFKRYNIIEYKSPEDSLSIDDFYKVLGYTYLYKAFGDKIDDKKIDEFSITFVCNKVPKKIFKHLKLIYGIDIIEKYKGIYYIKLNNIPIQFIISKNLSEEDNLWLYCLRNDLTKQDVRNVLKTSIINSNKSEIKAYLNSVSNSNSKIFEEVSDMAEIMENLANEGVFSKIINAKAQEVAQSMAQDMAQEVAKDMAKDIVKKNEKQSIRNLYNNGINIEILCKSFSDYTKEEIEKIVEVNK